MLHDITPPIPSAEEALKEAYRRVINESGDETITSIRAASDAADEVMKLIDLGEVEEPDRRSALLKTLKVIDSAEGRSADKIIAKLSRGEVHLFEDDEILNTVVTLGGGNRKTWRYINADDLRDMDRERRKNFEAQQEAIEKWNRDYSTVLPVVFEYRTVGAAFEAGAFSGEAVA